MMRQGESGAAALVALLLLSGCFGLGGVPEAATPTETGEAQVARAAMAAPVAPVPVLDAEMEDGSESDLIAALIARQSVLAPGPLAQVRDAVLAASSRAAEADLRAAMLREEAKSMNWLPRLGPQVSLTSLGALVTSMVLNQAIVDHGARRAEREHSRADVEVAAVRLAEDANARVLEALGLYLAAEGARARAAVSEAGLADMERFAWLMRERVDAGVNDRADLQVVTQKQDQMLADLAADREAVAVALAELAAMAEGDMGALRGLSDLGQPPADAVALTVLRAQAEGRRAVAAARVTRAGYLPGLAIGGDIAGDGIGATVGAAQGMGLGQGAAIEAAMAEAAAVEARVGQEEETAARTVAALQGQLDSLIRQQAELQSLAAQATANYALIAEQQRAGQRSVPETVSVFETMIRAERTFASVASEIALMRARIAALLGTLVDGERM